MNSEMLGLSYLQIALGKTDHLVAHINSNDKEPSWDGDVEVYRKAGHVHAKADLILKVPVQVKGHCKPNLKKKSIGLRFSQFCPCQNSPSTKIAILYLRTAMSGDPGRRLSFSLYRNPRCHRRFAKRTSALPCFRWTRDIRLDVSGVVSYDFGCFIWFYHRI